MTSRVEEAAELMGERETVYFGVSPYTLMDTIGEHIVETYSNLEARFPQNLSAACAFLTPAQVQAITQAWIQLVETAVDRNFELFETYCLRNVFKLPDNFVLPEESNLITDCVGEAEFELLLNNLKTAQTEKLKLHQYQSQLGNSPPLFFPIDSLEEAIGKLEANMEQLGALAELGPTVASVDNRLTDLKRIVNETLSASVRISTAVAHPEEEELYDRLLADLTILDDEAVRAKENRLEQECAAELARKQQVATFQDLDTLLQMLLSPKSKTHQQLQQ